MSNVGCTTNSHTTVNWLSVTLLFNLEWEMHRFLSILAVLYGLWHSSLSRRFKRDSPLHITLTWFNKWFQFDSRSFSHPNLSRWSFFFLRKKQSRVRCRSFCHQLFFQSFPPKMSSFKMYNQSCSSLVFLAEPFHPLIYPSEQSNICCYL